MKAWLSVIIPVVIELIGMLLAYFIANHIVGFIPNKAIALYLLGQLFLLLLIAVTRLFDI